MVSLIQSNYEGFGSGLVVPGLGFGLQDRGSLFNMEAAPPPPASLALQPPSGSPLQSVVIIKDLTRGQPAFCTLPEKIHVDANRLAGRRARPTSTSRASAPSTPLSLASRPSWTKAARSTGLARVNLCIWDGLPLGLACWCRHCKHATSLRHKTSRSQVAGARLFHGRGHTDDRGDECCAPGDFTAARLSCLLPKLF